MSIVLMSHGHKHLDLIGVVTVQINQVSENKERDNLYQANFKVILT
jgi:hypothetical protein